MGATPEARVVLGFELEVSFETKTYKTDYYCERTDKCPLRDEPRDPETRFCSKCGAEAVVESTEIVLTGLPEPLLKAALLRYNSSCGLDEPLTAFDDEAWGLFLADMRGDLGDGLRIVKRDNYKRADEYLIGAVCLCYGDENEHQQLAPLSQSQRESLSEWGWDPAAAQCFLSLVWCG